MKREWIIFGVGVLVFFLPMLGFPRAFNNTLYILAGLLLIVLALREIRKRYMRELHESKESPPQV